MNIYITSLVMSDIEIDDPELTVEEVEDPEDPDIVG